MDCEYFWRRLAQIYAFSGNVALRSVAPRAFSVRVKVLSNPREIAAAEIGLGFDFAPAPALVQWSFARLR